MANGQRVDPFVNFNFKVELDGIIQAAFHEVSGLDSSIDVIEHREGGDITPSKYPGQTKYTNITLRRGITPDTQLYDWHRQWATGDPAAQRKNGSIVLLDRQGQEKMRWNFQSAWPAKWTGPSFSSEDNNIAIESIDLAHEGVKLAH
jgi:phage tail-like protein